MQFFGILDTLPFTEITVFSTGFVDLFTIDRVRFDDPTASTPVPEPASLTLLGLGLLAAGRRIRYGRRVAKAFVPPAQNAPLEFQ